MAFAAITLAAVGSLGYIAATGGLGQQSATGPSGQVVVDGSGNAVQETKDATLTVNAFDTGGSSSTEVTDADTSVWKASTNDAYGTRLKSASSFTIGGATVSSGLSNKDAYTIVEGDDSYYAAETGRADGEDIDQPPRNIAIDGSTQPTYQYNLVSVAAESDLSMTAYDDRGNQLTTGSNSNQEDYEVSLSADEDKTIEVELKQTGTDKYLDACGVAYKTLNDVDDVAAVRFTGPAGDDVRFADEGVAEHLETDIAMNESNGLNENVSKYDGVFRFDQNVRLGKNDKLVMNFDIQADSDNDPTAVESGDLTTTDALLVQFKDCDWYETPGLGADSGYHDESSSEADVGLDESDNSPLGGESGMIIEAT
jgi:hypothetical protein